MRTELEEGGRRRAHRGGKTHTLGRNRGPRESWAQLGNVRPSPPCPGLLAVGPHTSGLTSLCPHLSKWATVAALLAVENCETQVRYDQRPGEAFSVLLS